jgi:hypothetical protein
MDLSTDSIEILEKIITKLFNGKIIDKIAECGCSNACEGFFGQLKKFTEGKHLQGNETNFWQSVLELCFCNKNGKDTERTKVELSVILNLPVTPVETISHSTVATKRMKDYARHSLPLAKERQVRAKIYKSQRIDADANKSKHHKSEKVKVKAPNKSAKEQICSNCGLIGHSAQHCVLAPAPKKREEQFIVW